jgi:hypothetical protein
LIVDIGGNTSLSKLRRVPTRHGTLVIVGGEGRCAGGLNRPLTALAIAPFVRQGLPSRR